LDVCLDMAGAFRPTSRAATGPRGRREPALLELGDQRLECQPQHLCHVPGRQLVTEQPLRVTQGVMRLLVDRALERKPLRRQRFHPGTLADGSGYMERFGGLLNMRRRMLGIGRSRHRDRQHQRRHIRPREAPRPAAPTRVTSDPRQLRDRTGVFPSMPRTVPRALPLEATRNVTRPPDAALHGSGMDDATLVTRVLEGDVAAFTEIVHRYHRDCTRFAARMLGDRHDAEDAIQETFLSAYSALGRYREQQTFRAWLFRILVNRCRSVARQRRRRRQRFLEDGAAPEAAGPLAPERDPGLRDALQGALDSLEPLLREAFLLKYGEGLEYREMSQLTGAGVSALKMRVQRACQAMRPQLKAEFDAGQ